MLALDSLEWSSLRDAYGPADDTPHFLKKIEQNPKRSDRDDEAWEGLWSGLCHQGDVYTASYAAVPHIVRIARAAHGPIDFSFFLLPACIEIARARKRGPTVPASLTESYSEAWRLMPDCIFAHMQDDWTQEAAMSIGAALFASKGQIDLAEVIQNLDENIIRKVIELDF